MQLTGTLTRIGQTETVGNNGFKKRQVLIRIEENTQYPQMIPVEFVQAKVDALNNYQEGQQVVIDINLRGSEYNGRNFCSIQGWKISPTGQQSNYQAPQPAGNYVTGVPDAGTDPNESLPF